MQQNPLCKYRKKLALTTAFSALVLVLQGATGAFADGSFLLQLGMFETRNEAQKKWDDIRAANMDLLAKLQGHVAEVMLPPDNIPTYRTQAGPVESRKEAKNLCNTLLTRNVDCVIVETAFAASDLSPEMSGESLAQKPVAKEPTKPVVTEVAPAATQPEQQITSSPVEPVATPVAIPSTQPAEPAQAPKATMTVAAPTPKVEMPASTTPVAKEAVMEQQKTEIKTTRSASAYSNPNDVKKPGFFRGAFRFQDKDIVNSSTTVSTSESEEKKEDNKPGFFGRLFGNSETKEEATAKNAETAKPQSVTTAEATPAPNAPDVKGEVEVAEAIRVPVTTQVNPNPPETAKYLPVEVDSTDNSKPLQVIESEEIGAVTWIQVSYFSSEGKAYAFYDRLKKLTPDLFHDVNTRLTRPFADKPGRVSLRMGPFNTDEGSVTVCNAAKRQHLRCTSIRDESQAQPGQAPRKHYPSPLEAVDIPAYKGGNSANAVATSNPLQTAPVQENMTTTAPASGVTVSDTGVGAPWVTLGEYNSTQEAWNHWKSLQNSIISLKGTKPVITGLLGGDNAGKFQLKAGPFRNRPEAEDTCKAIVNAGDNCSIVAAQ